MSLVRARACLLLAYLTGASVVLAQPPTDSVEVWRFVGPTVALADQLELGTAVAILARDPWDPDAILAGTPSGRVYRLHPNSEPDLLEDGLPGTEILALHTDMLYRRVFAGTRMRGVFVSDDGSTWQSWNGDRITSTAWGISAATRRVHAVLNHWLMSTIQDRPAWEGISIESQFRAVATHPSLPGKVFAGAIGNASGIYFSEDDGHTWTKTNRTTALRIVIPARDASRQFVLTNYDKVSVGDLSTGALAPVALPGIKPEALSGGVAHGVDRLIVAGDRRVFVSTTSGDTWSQVGDLLPDAPIADVLQMPGGAVYVATGHGVFTTDPRADEKPDVRWRVETQEPPPVTGDTWRLEGPDPRVLSAVVDPMDGEITVSTSSAGLWRSTDDGVSWQRVSETFGFGGTTVLHMVLDADLGRLYAAAANGLYYSDNDGLSWPRLANLQDPRSLALHPEEPAAVLLVNAAGIWLASLGKPSQRLAAPATFSCVEVVEGSAYAGGTDGVWLKDRFDRWARIGRPAATFSLAEDYGEGDLYAGTTDGVYRLERGTWTALDLRSGDHPVYVATHAARPDWVYAAADGVLYVSEDRGGSWRQLRRFGTHFATATRLVEQFAENTFVSDPLAAGRVLVLHFGLKSVTDGHIRSASRIEAGPNVSHIGVSLTNPELVLAIADGVQFHRQVGGKWIAPDSSESVRVPSFQPIENRTGQWVHDYHGFDRWLDSADDFLRLGLNPRDTAVNPRNPRVHYHGRPDGAFVSYDGGQQWQTMRVGGQGHYVAVAVDPYEPRTLYYGSNDWTPGLFRSRDGGTSFVAIQTDTVSLVETSWTSPGLLYAVVAGRLRRSRDRGSNWQEVESPGTEGVVLMRAAFSRSEILYITTAFGAYVSIDAGESWADVSAGLPVAAVQGISIDPMNPMIAYVATSSGIYSRGADFAEPQPGGLGSSTGGGEGSDPPLPVRWALGRPFPNPFNQSLVVPFDVAAYGRVRVELYDLLGQRVATLLDAEVAPGQHSLRVEVSQDANRMATGVFFVVMRMAGTTQMQKVLLIR